MELLAARYILRAVLVLVAVSIVPFFISLYNRRRALDGLVCQWDPLYPSEIPY